MGKLFKISLGLLLTFILVGCKTTKVIKNDLEAKGWTVTVIDEDSLNQITNVLGPGIIESNVKTVLMGIKALKMGFVLEFNRYSDAKAYYNNLVQKDRTGVYKRGKLVIISDSTEFIDIVD